MDSKSRLEDIRGLSEISSCEGLIDYDILQNPNFASVFTSYEQAREGKYANMDYFPVKTSDNKFRIMIGSNSDEYLYRGERNEYFDLVPGLKRLQGIDKAIAWIQTDMFKECLRASDYMKLNQMKIEQDNLFFELDLEAIAQHYYFRTNYLDFTKDWKVAEFFAYTKFEDGIYKPITKFESHPKIYRVKINHFVEDNPKSFKIVGLQCAARAVAQKALALDFNEKIDTGRIEEILLDKEPERAKEIFDYFDGGRKLFPEDLLTRISTNFSKYKNHLYKGSIIKYAQKERISFYKLQRELLKLNFNITDNILKPDKKDNEIINEDVLRWKNLMIRKSLIIRKYYVGDYVDNELKKGIKFIAGQINDDIGRAIVFDIIDPKKKNDYL